MLKLIGKILHQIRICFKREEETFAWLVTIVKSIKPIWQFITVSNNKLVELYSSME